MIRIERTPHGEVRIIGALDEKFLTRLIELVGPGKVVLDLSEVSEADAASVRMLASQNSGYRLVNCPRWLVLWIERERQPHPLVDMPRVGRLES